MAGTGELLIIAGLGLAVACFVIPGWPCNVWLATEGAKNQAQQNQLFPQVGQTGRGAFPSSVPAAGGTKAKPNFTAQQNALFPKLTNSNITLA